MMEVRAGVAAAAQAVTPFAHRPRVATVLVVLHIEVAVEGAGRQVDLGGIPIEDIEPLMSSVASGDRAIEQVVPHRGAASEVVRLADTEGVSGGIYRHEIGDVLHHLNQRPVAIDGPPSVAIAVEADRHQPLGTLAPESGIAPALDDCEQQRTALVVSPLMRSAIELLPAASRPLDGVFVALALNVGWVQ